MTCIESGYQGVTKQRIRESIDAQFWDICWHSLSEILTAADTLHPIILQFYISLRCYTREIALTWHTTHNIHKRSQVWSPALWSKTKHFYVPQLMIYMPTKNEMKSTQQYLFVYLFFRIFFSPPLTLSNVALLPNNRILRILKMFYSRMSPLSQSVETNIFF